MRNVCAANVFRLTKSDGETTEIGVPEAAAIRSKEPLEVGDPRQMFVRVDAITKHSNRGAVELPDTPGRYVSAEFRDPLFDTKPNPYIAAMDSGDLIEVTAVPSLRAGELQKLYIMALAAKAAA